MDPEEALERLREALNKANQASQAIHAIQAATKPTQEREPMPDNEKFLTRITVDLVTDEPLSERRQMTMAREVTENLHVLVVEDEDQPLKEVEKYINAHTHDTADGTRCQVCVEQSLDYRSGTGVANGDF